MDVSPEGPSSGEPHVWSASRYPSLAPNFLPPIARLVNGAGIDAGDRVLDVGCGTGNAAVTARHHGAAVVGVDIAPRMIDLARENAAQAAYDDVAWTVGDAQHLPFADGAFDVVLSNFGHVFAPSSTVAGAELRRVAASGGRVAFTSWSPDGLVGELTEVLTRHVDHPRSDPWAHLRWGDPSFVREQFPRDDVSVERRVVEFRYVSPRHFWREFAEESGPLSPELRKIDDEETRRRLREDAIGTLSEWFADNAVRIGYLQVRVTVGGEAK